MKIVAISDTHMYHNKITIPKGDVLIHAGDYSRYGTRSDLIGFVEWLASLGHEHKIFIAGNHDQYLEGVNPVIVNKIIKNIVGEDSGITYLFDTSITIDGKKIYGSPWQPEFCNWSFQAPRGVEMAKKWNWIPHDTDILVTHGPPYGHGDFIPKDKRSVGCIELLKKIIKVQPYYHICGHIHEGYGRTRSDEVRITKFINASICDEGYKPTNKAWRLEI